MIAILHGTWLPASGSFFLWGEAATRAARRGRQPKVPAHPGQFTYGELHERLAELPSSSAIPPESEQTVWLPSAGGAPLPLREQRAAGAEVREGPVTLAPWRVRGLLLPPGLAVEALLADCTRLIEQLLGAGAKLEQEAVPAAVALRQLEAV